MRLPQGVSFACVVKEWIIAGSAFSLSRKYEFQEMCHESGKASAPQPYLRSWCQ